MWNHFLQLDMYQYVRTNPYVVRIIGLLGIAATFLMAYGMWRFTQLSIWYLIFFGPIIFIFVINKLLRFFLELFYPKYDISRHEKFIHDFWATHAEPSVDIFLPWAGENLKIHEEVIQAAAHLNYTNYKIYMLDDKGSEEHKHLAEKYGCIYLSRPNKGQYKKSGNLEFGYRHSQGEFIFILDADFIPTRESLKNIVPYIAEDRSIGILQTPQYFEQTNHVHKRSPIEFGGGNIVEDFYRILMPSRDEFKAAMCVGTSALYRREAILKLNGTPKVHASEDLATGLLITQFGYYVKYLPLIVSMGKSPETFQGYFKQHMRWCSGNLVFLHYWPRARLSLMARLIYIVNPLYYMSEALTLVFSFQFLLLLYFNPSSLSLWNTLYFLPYAILSRIIIPMTKKNKNKMGTRLAALSNAYTYLYTYIRMLIRGVPTWQPTGVQTSLLHRDFLQAIDMGAIISGLFIAGFIFVLVKRPFIFGDYNAYVILAWTVYSVFWHGLFLTFVLRYIHKVKLRALSSQFENAFLFAKAHAILVLCLIATGYIFFDIALTVHNPRTPIALAVSQVQEKKNPLPLIASRIDPHPTKTLLATRIKDEKTSSGYIFVVKEGDTLTKVAMRAITSYANSQQIHLTATQTEYAATLLVKNEKITMVKPNKQITFKLVPIEQAILETLEAFYPQTSVSPRPNL